MHKVEKMTLHELEKAIEEIAEEKEAQAEKGGEIDTCREVISVESEKDEEMEIESKVGENSNEKDLLEERSNSSVEEIVKLIQEQDIEL